MKNRGKTLEEHREYLYKIVRLKLFFLHRWLAEHPEESFRHVIRNRVDIYRKTDANPGPMTPEKLFFDSPAWLEMEEAAGKMYIRYKTEEGAFEDAAFAVFRPSIDARCVRDYEDKTSIRRYQCGCFRHDPEVRDKERNALEFHIMNSLAPDSFLDHPDYVKQCFLQLLEIAAEKFHASRIRTCTWLNSLPKWVAFFPEEWRKNMSGEYLSVEWHYGFWGQFLSARGTFNERYGAYLRETGRLPFYPRASWCSIASMRQKCLEEIH